ncbi:MAG: hypothetical protein ACI85Q_001760 [Salibacteraceae bacterium]|jgi:hypothetical protein
MTFRSESVYVLRYLKEGVARRYGITTARVFFLIFNGIRTIDSTIEELMKRKKFINALNDKLKCRMANTT